MPIAEYDLRDIRIFDLNPLFSSNVQSRLPTQKQASDLRLAQSTTWKTIKAEPPTVLLVLMTRTGRSDIPGLRRFRCSLRSAGTMKIDRHLRPRVSGHLRISPQRVFEERLCVQERLVSKRCIASPRCSPFLLRRSICVYGRL